MLDDVDQGVFDEVLKSLDRALGISGFQTLFDAVPTCILSGGINAHEGDSGFGRLLDRMEQRGWMTAVLRGDSDGGNLKSALKSMMAQLVYEVMDEDDSDLDLSEYTAHDVQVLPIYYRSKWGQQKSGGAVQPKTIILVPDIERFDKGVLQNLVLILHNLKQHHTLPIALILGCSTGADRLIGDLLSGRTIEMIAYERFWLQEPRFCLDRLIEELFIKGRAGIKLSHAQLACLVDQFTLMDYSFSSFKMTLKYCLMVHFLSDPLSILSKVGTAEMGDIQLVLRILVPGHMESIRMLPSFRAYIEDLVEAEHHSLARQLIEDDFKLLDELPTMMKRLKRALDCFQLAFNMFDALVQRLQTKTFKKTRTDVFLAVMEPGFLEADDFKHTTRLIKYLSTETMRDYLSTCADYLESSSTDTKQSKFNEAFLQLKQSFDQDFSSLEGSNAEYKDFLLECHSLFSGFFQRGFNFQVPLIELLFTGGSSVQKLKKAFSPQLRSAIHTALSYPVHYLGCECCDIRRELGVSATFEDICVAYQIYSESGKMINLSDWFLSFSAILEQPKTESATSSTRKTSKKGVVNDKSSKEEMLSRFLRCILEMQYMGFIKKTNRKVDHVLRMTWGM